MTSTITFGDYLLGCLGLAAIAVSLGLAAIRLRARFLPGWIGAPARLAESILALGLLVLVLELLGVAGLFEGWAIVAGCILLAALVLLGEPRAIDRLTGGGLRGTIYEARAQARAEAAPTVEPPSPAAHKLQLGIAIAVTLLLFAQWAMPTFLALDRGIYGGDSLWYHLPFAADFARSGSITALHFTDPLYLNWFYPQNSELIHGAGMTLFDNDFLSPLINLAWLGMALLAAWCIGRPYGAGAISLTGVAILLAADLMFSRQPGNANNDVVGLALLLAAVAMLINRAPINRETGTTRAGLVPLGIAGLAAGLALGTKLTFVVPVAALTVGVVVLAQRGARRAAAIAWSVPLLIGGGFWYARNLIVAGNPLPWAKLGIGPVALPRSEELEGRDPFSITDYATDGGVWRHYFFPGLNERFGELWPALLALAALGVILALIRGGRTARMLALVAIVTTIAYVLTPLSASGQEGAPLGFRLNLRYLAPALAIGLVLLAAPAAQMPGRQRASAGAILALLLAILLLGHSPLAALDDGYLAAALVTAAAAATAIAISLLAPSGPRLALAAGALAAIAVAALAWPQQEDYERYRYARNAPHYPASNEHPGSELATGLDAAYEWARGQRDQSIAIGGTTAAFFQYGLYGPDSSNRVRYVGERGPRGSFDEIDDCKSWRAALNEGGYGFVVTTPGYDQDMPDRPLPAPFRGWTAGDPAAKAVLQDGRVTIFRLDGPLDPEACA